MNENDYEKARIELGKLPGNLYYKLPSGNIVAFEQPPSTKADNHWSSSFVTYEQAVEAVANGAEALTHEEAYEDVLLGSFNKEPYMLMALDLADDPLYALEDVISEYNTEAGAAWVSCDEEDPTWAKEEETGKIMVCTSEGLEIK